MVMPVSDASAAIDMTDEEFRWAQEAFDRGERWL
jgi:hypothetical protein